MRFLKAVLVLALSGFLAGFFVFAATLDAPSRFDLSQHRFVGIDRSQVGIVALTGGGGARIERALTLYADGVADRVLISGTHPTVRKADLGTTGDLAILECCVDLGPKARTTIGNGIEAAEWATLRGYDAVYLVTSHYHLPRALVELKAEAPGLTVIGVPVASLQVPETGWLTSPAALNLLAREYVKYLAATARHML